LFRGYASFSVADALATLLRRHQKSAKPMAASAAMPPMTGPAIHALLAEEVGGGLEGSEDLEPAEEEEFDGFEEVELGLEDEMGVSARRAYILDASSLTTAVVFIK
jgi:hypothetical protein